MFRISALHLIVIAVCVYDILQSQYENEKKILWIVIVILIPILGAIAWYLVSRRYIKL